MESAVVYCSDSCTLFSWQFPWTCWPPPLLNTKRWNQQRWDFVLCCRISVSSVKSNKNKNLLFFAHSSCFVTLCWQAEFDQKTDRELAEAAGSNYATITQLTYRQVASRSAIKFEKMFMKVFGAMQLVWVPSKVNCASVVFKASQFICSCLYYGCCIHEIEWEGKGERLSERYNRAKRR